MAVVAGRVAAVLARILKTPGREEEVVGLVQRYSNNSTGVVKLRQLATLQPPGRSSAPTRRLPRRARRLTVTEKAAFVEEYEQGERIAVLAQRLGVHRTTLDTLVTRLGLSRAHPDEVPAAIRSSVVDSYRAGQSLAAIGGQFGFSANKVQRLLVATGEPIRPRGPAKPALTGAQVEDMVARYEQGETIAAIAEAARVSYAQARGCLIEAGVEMRPRGGAK